MNYSKSVLSAAASIALFALLGGIPAAFAFGGEDVKNGRPWHHLDMTLRALAGDQNSGAQVTLSQFRGAGFSREAAMSIAWHADYIDSYLYNPIWWAQGAPSSKRFKTALTQFDHLAKLHHDDTFTAAGVKDNWERYTSGLLVGLYWAAENNDVAAAHQLLGIASHAAQDFYSHSNWIDDPIRRKKTWFEVPTSTRYNIGLYTGAYEHSDSQAPHHHGAYSLSCSVLNQSAVGSTVSAICGGISPFAATSLCVANRGCQGAASVPISVADSTLSDVVYLQPKGIAMDTTWLSRIGGAERSLIDVTGSYRAGKSSPNMTANACNAVINYGVECSHSGAELCTRGGESRSCQKDSDFLFAETKTLAIRTTSQYMAKIEKAMKDIDATRSTDRYEVFWERVKSEKSSLNQRIKQFEDFKQVPFQFMSSGKYPIRNAATSAHPTVRTSHGWYIRARIATSGANLSGTDADIKLKVEGDGWSRTKLLDYLPTNDTQGRTDSRFLVYNDFEAGDNDVYTVGPFPGRPTRVTLINDSAGAGDVLDALWDDFTEGLDETLTDLRRGLISLIGGNADFVGQKKSYLSFDTIVNQINAQGGAVTRSLTVDGGNEGKYRVSYTANFANSVLSAQQRSDGWKAIQFKLTKLKCFKESEVDRGSNSDEPFFFFTLSPLNGLSDAKVVGYWSKVYDDVDSGESRNITGNRTYTLKIPPQGGIAAALQVWESDSENTNDRRQLWTTFTTGLNEETRRGNGQFIDALGRAVAEDWRVNSVEIIPFRRGVRPEVAPKLSWANVGWIDGGERKSKNLPTGATQKLIPTNRGDISTWTAPLRAADLNLENIGIITQVPDRVRIPSGGLIRNRTITDQLTVPTVWQGTWSSSFGPLRLVHTISGVSGDYSNVGTIKATYDPSSEKLSGTFTNAGREGELEFVLNGGEFSGKWRWKGQTAWNASGWNGKRESSKIPKLVNSD